MWSRLKVIKMFRDRLTPLALRRTRNRIITPVIVKARPGRLRSVVEAVSQFNAFDFIRERGPFGVRAFLPEQADLFMAVPRVMEMTGMVSAIMTRDGIFDVAQDSNVDRIFSDELMYAFAYPVVPTSGVFKDRGKSFTTTFFTRNLLGANVANKRGFTGKGITVGVVDTGGSRFHEQTRQLEFITTMPAQKADMNGHGEWVASCIGGSRETDEFLSRRLGGAIECEGIAPGCGLLGIKCLGYGIGTGSTSNIIEGIEIALKNGAGVINMSLGGDIPSDVQEDDPYYHAFQVVEEENAVAVVANGNSGPGEGTVESPAWLENCLSVGAYDPITGDVADYSSRGSTPDGRIKPDCIAPGSEIHSAAVGMMDAAGDNAKQRYTFVSGTSMATPHVAGIITLMRQAYQQTVGGAFTLGEVKTMLSQLGHPKNNTDGWGIIDWAMFERWMDTQYGVKV